MAESASLGHLFWLAFGAIGTAIFYSRFYVQWIASERARRSVMPIAFWYLSSAGALMLLIYAVFEQSPVGALSFSINGVIYSRNLGFIWKERGGVSRARRHLFQAAMGTIALAALSIVAFIWWRELEHTKTAPRADAVENWLWIAVGTLGTALFATRFIVQWIATEIRRKSVVPHVFWHISVVATLLQLACYVQRAEWIYAIGLVANLPVYARNLWFIYKYPDRPLGPMDGPEPGAGDRTDEPSFGAVRESRVP